MKKILPILLALVFYTNSYACSCNGIEEQITKNEIEKYSIIINGTVISRQCNGHQIISKFKINKIFKGEVFTDTVSIITNTGICGLKVEVGQEWLLYAKGSIIEDFWTSMCFRSSTMHLNQTGYNPERMRNDIQFLEKFIESDR